MKIPHPGLLRKALALVLGLIGSSGLLASPPEPEGHEFLSEAPRFDLFPSKAVLPKTDDDIARELADLKFCEIYGACGITILKSHTGNIWIFSTFVGYAGSPKEDIYIILPRDRIKRELSDFLGDWTSIRLTRR